MEQHYREPAYSAFKGAFVGRDGQPYMPDPGLVAAANVALALDRPLLLTGEPGCGKTEFAFAATTSLTGNAHAQPEQAYVRSDTSARDLLYRYDAVRRFSDAQMSVDPGARALAANARNYIVLEALGRALVSPTRTVVLIDEIDKAQRDLPNDLLRELDRGEYDLPEIPDGEEGFGARLSDGLLRRVMRRPVGAVRPLIIVTSNVERQLPEAFLRRCIFYYVPFPEDRLLAILNSRFGAETMAEQEDAIRLFVHLRSQGLKKTPATAELIDWVGALTEVFAPQHVWPRLALQARALTGTGIVDWSALDGLSALVKLREDRILLGLEPSGTLPR